MKLNTLIFINSLVWIAIGIAFALYGPVMLAFFGVPDIPSDNTLLYWNVASFARLFGAAMFGFGMLLFALRDLEQALPSARRGVLFSMLLANAMCAIVAIVQQSAVWTGYTGWVLAGIFILFLLPYAYFLAQKEALAPRPG